MDLSVIICTYNRAESLRRTLESVRHLDQRPEWKWELIVVDNNSNDGTTQVCESFRDQLPLVYLFEAQQGKSNALNRAVAAARSPLLVFTDDDVDLNLSWLTTLWNAAQARPDVSFFGGKVLPRWEKTPPSWVIEHIDWLMINVHVDRGNKEIELKNGDSPFLVGCNVMFRKSVFETGMQFRADISPTGADHSLKGNLRGEEIFIEKDLLAAGHKGLYVPDAIIYHRHAPHRVTEKYLRQWYAGWGTADIRVAPPPADMPRWFGVPRFVWRNLVWNAIKFLATRWTRPSRVWLLAEIRMAFAWGVIVEFRRELRQARECNPKPANPAK